MKISVKIKPGSREEKVEKIDGIYKVNVHEIAENGKANGALVKILAEYFDIAKARVKIVSGFTSKNKIMEIK